MSKKYNDFDEADQAGFFDQVFGLISNRRREFAIFSVLAAVAVLGLILWDSARGNGEDVGSESVPIVRADAGDYKTAPDNPGGMEVPYRDSTVFGGDETAQNGTAGTENILAEDTTEEPVSKEQLFAGLNTDQAEVSTQQPFEEAAPAQDVAKAEPVDAPEASSADDELFKEAIGAPPSAEDAVKETKEMAAAIIPESAKSAVSEKPAPRQQPTQEAKVASKIETAAGSSVAKAIKPGNYYAQLAAVRSLDGATGEYKKLQAQYSALSGLKFRTQEANLGAKGTFYRIQAGPMSKDSAAKVCASVKARGGACIVAGK